MCNVSIIQSSLSELFLGDINVLEIHSYDANLQVEAFDLPFNFRLPSPVNLTGKVQVLCSFQSAFIIFALDSNNEILISESGYLDSEVVLSRFGQESIIYE